MKIYFTASLTGKEQYHDEYRAIDELLKALGYVVDSKQVLDTDPTKPEKESRKEKVEVFRELSRAIKKVDAVVAEISYPSTSVGYQISEALDLGKPVIALHLREKSARLLEGITDERLQVIPYDKNNLKKVLVKALEVAKQNVDIRFNFFVTPKILAYLDWVAEKRRTPRSVYLRGLIEKEIKQDREYLSDLDQ